MALSIQKKAMLLHLAKAGDIFAQEALQQDGTGRAGFVSIGAPAAPAVAVHAAIAATTSVVPVTTAITSPVAPRNLAVVFLATWDGGDAVVVGTNQFGKVVTETFLDPGVGGGTVVGSKVFKTVTSVAHTAVGTAGTYAVQTGSKLGLVNDVLDGFGIGLCDGVPEKVTLDSANESVLFTTAPNGTRVFVLLCNI